MLFTTAACIFSTSELQKVLPDPQFFSIFTSKCAFRHRRRHFFNICTYKSGPNTSCFVHFHFQMCFSPQRRAIFSTSELQKVLGGLQFFNIFTSKCAFRHRRRHFFNICTYKSGPNTSCFVHFHFQMSFSPQRRAFFRHLNFKKFSEDCSFLTISLPNVLFATAACNF